MQSEKAQALLRGWMAWYEAMGVDCAVGDAAIDRFAVSANPSQRRVAVKSAENTAKNRSEGTVTAPRQLPLPASGTAVSEAEKRARAAKDLSELRAALNGFDLCPLRATATNTVFGVGIDTNPDVMIIGEGPGAEEDRLGEPFVGQSGRLLDRMLAEVGLSRHHNIFISNMVYWRPPGNRAPTELEIAMCLPFMLRMIQLIKPRIILAVGNTPSRALLETKDGIVKLRGKFFYDRTYGGDVAIPTLATFHPAYLLRSPGQKKFVWQDLLSLRIYLLDKVNSPPIDILNTSKYDPSLPASLLARAVG